MKVCSCWTLNQILVSPSVPCHSATSSGGLQWVLVHGEIFMVFGFTYMQVRQRRKVKAGHSSYLVRQARGQIEIVDSIRVCADTIDESCVIEWA